MTILWMFSPPPSHSTDYANLAPFTLKERNNNNNPQTPYAELKTNSVDCLELKTSISFIW
jgi:hypothetical protein